MGTTLMLMNIIAARPLLLLLLLPRHATTARPLLLLLLLPRHATPARPLLLLSSSTIGGGGDMTFPSTGRSPKQPLPEIRLHDPLHGRQACPELNSFHQRVVQIFTRQGLVFVRPLPKRGLICYIPFPPPIVERVCCCCCRGMSPSRDQCCCGCCCCRGMPPSRDQCCCGCCCCRGIPPPRDQCCCDCCYCRGMPPPRDTIWSSLCWTPTPTAPPSRKPRPTTRVWGFDGRSGNWRRMN